MTKGTEALSFGTDAADDEIATPCRNMARWTNPLVQLRGIESGWKRCRPLCHPDRSVAKWSDLQFSGPLLEMFFEDVGRLKRGDCVTGER
jgi:hypothetical protein